MKKLFTFAIALMAAMAMNATDYYFAGAANGWSNNSTKFTDDVGGFLTVTLAEFSGDFKVTEDGNWHPQHGAASDADSLRFNTPFTLTKCDGTNDAPANVHVALGANQYYKDAKLTLTEKDGVLTVTLVAGTLVDTSADPEAYFLVGACTNNWSLDAAIRFDEKDGVLTANVADLNGTFKILKAKASKPAWGVEYASNGSGLVLNEAYTTVLGGGNIALANPFGGYTDAVLTIAENGDDVVLTLKSGTFYVTKNDWFIPGGWQGWKCDATAKMDPVEGKTNTYELLVPEFGGEFKVVYGEWAVEFGAAKGSEATWTVNTPMELAFPCDNMKPADAEAKYIDVTITLVVDYENVAATLTIATEEQGIETVILKANSIKRIENGQVIIENNGVRYNMNGAKQ